MNDSGCRIRTKEIQAVDPLQVRAALEAHGFVAETLHGDGNIARFDGALLHHEEWGGVVWLPDRRASDWHRRLAECIGMLAKIEDDECPRAQARKYFRDIDCGACKGSGKYPVYRDAGGTGDIHLNVERYLMCGNCGGRGKIPEYVP